MPVTLSFAAGSGWQLDKVDIDVSDKAAMQDGARTFANYCMGCHSAKFQRYERVADDLGIPHESCSRTWCSPVPRLATT
jgi:ubiquinol-cytochrome c reductase cytochrome c1 subunit